MYRASIVVRGTSRLWYSLKDSVTLQRRPAWLRAGLPPWISTPQT